MPTRRAARRRTRRKSSSSGRPSTDGAPKRDLRRNWLLRALTADDHDAVDGFEPIRLEFKQVLYERDQPIRHVYFPLGGVMSILMPMSDSQPVEVATVGNEGMVGLPVFLGADRSPSRAICQIEGPAVRMTARDFREVAEGSEALTGALHRYVQALLNQITQSAACNRTHPIDERASRWLLMTHDRVGDNRFPLTQDLWAQMLGVRRASVNTAAGVLQKAGFIRYRRGVIDVLDRKGLESAACECYGVIRREFERLLPGTKTA